MPCPAMDRDLAGRRQPLYLPGLHTWAPWAPSGRLTLLVFLPTVSTKDLIETCWASRAAVGHRQRRVPDILESSARGRRVCR